MANRELVAVPKVLELSKTAEDKPSAGTALVVGYFGPKADYVPFGQDLETLRRRLKKPAFLDVPSDENM